MTESSSIQPKTVKGMNLDHSAAELESDKLVWRPSAYAMIFNNKGEILLLDNDYNHKLDFPGGGIEIWETSIEAVKREVWEETGLTVTVGGLIHADDAFFMTPSKKHWHTIKFYYRATIMDGTLRNTIIHNESSINPHWVDPRPLTKSDLTSGWDALQVALMMTL